MISQATTTPCRGSATRRRPPGTPFTPRGRSTRSASPAPARGSRTTSPRNSTTPPRPPEEGGPSPLTSPRTPSTSGGDHPSPSDIGKTRTKDKYRVVYTDHQRLELEKEFQSTRYITMRRKSDLSMALGLSERQVKIWFQNRRAKERKINRKKLQHSQQASTTTPTPPVLSGLTEAHVTSSPGASASMLSDIKTEEY
uniref:Homeobox protein CDX-1-like n=1 Tax=Poecilia latipinna TaxID=48699 RepID=A0A3B3ULD1_9TELE